MVKVFREQIFLGESKISDLWLDDTEENRRYLEASIINMHMHPHALMRLEIDEFELKSTKIYKPKNPVPLEDYLGVNNG